MQFSNRLIRVLRAVLPTPFTIAVGLTALVFLVALVFTRPAESDTISYWLHLVDSWEGGLWKDGLLVFAVQMMLMLVLGHVLALSEPVDKLIAYFVSRFCSTAAGAAFSITFFTVAVGLFNWGLGLIFGAVFARKAGEYAASKGIATNYALLGAAGYSGLMVWHGGFSGSSLAKVAENGHLKDMMGANADPSLLAALPESIGYGDTVFSSMNLTCSLALLVILPLGMRWLMERSEKKAPVIPKQVIGAGHVEEEPGPADKLDRSTWIALSFGILIFFTALYKAFTHPGFAQLGFISPNWINLNLLGLGIIFHKRFANFLAAVDEAISGASGILIQFPLYFGIMGVMSGSGLVNSISLGFVDLCASIGNESMVYPILTFISAGIVNVFVPSGGGQWAVQGPIIIQAATEMGVPLAKSIMAMAYGDQLTNMLQPFWALPLLGITGLKAKQILPYTLFLMGMGMVIFVFSLILFS